MIQFEAMSNYLGRDIKVTSDTFEELHQAISGIAELNSDYRFLATKVQDQKSLIPYFRTTNGVDFYGIRDAVTGKNVTFGKPKEKRPVPFFPKGIEGFFDPAEHRGL